MRLLGCKLDELLLVIARVLWCIAGYGYLHSPFKMVIVFMHTLLVDFVMLLCTF